MKILKTQNECWEDNYHCNPEGITIQRIWVEGFSKPLMHRIIDPRGRFYEEGETLSRDMVYSLGMRYALYLRWIKQM